MDLFSLSSHDSLALRFKNWRRKIKCRLPYVRRREHRLLESRLESALQTLSQDLPRATACGLRTLVERPAASRDVCLFVTHAPGPSLKAHVLHHVEKLQRAGLDVVFIVNTDQDPEAFSLPVELRTCRAVHVRENKGYDFGAWAQVALQGRYHAGAQRLFLINDSVFGPTDDGLFQRLLDKIRASDADVIGLTEALQPRHHLQSYFLVLQGAALAADVFEPWARSVRLLPTKDLVVDVYETRLTTLFRSQGLTCEAMFPTDPGLAWCSNDTCYRWQGLLAQGFPYIKVSVLARQRRVEVAPRVSSKLLRAWEREQSFKAAP